jgi:hypothetical protein
MKEADMMCGQGHLRTLWASSTLGEFATVPPIFILYYANAIPETKSRYDALRLIHFEIKR